MVFEDDSTDAENVNCVSLGKLKNETMRPNDDMDENLENETVKSVSSDHHEDRVGYTKSYLSQPAFQPSATSKTLEHRYMVWNNVGIVRAHKNDSENSIEVEFHDSVRSDKYLISYNYI